MADTFPVRYADDPYGPTTSRFHASAHSVPNILSPDGKKRTPTSEDTPEFIENNSLIDIILFTSITTMWVTTASLIILSIYCFCQRTNQHRLFQLELEVMIICLLFASSLIILLVTILTSCIYYIDFETARYYSVVAIMFDLLSIVLLCIVVVEANMAIKKHIRTELHDAMHNMFNEVKNNEGNRALWEDLQFRIECCGVDSPDDWMMVLNLTRPPSCCENMDEDDNCIEPIEIGCFEKYERRQNFYMEMIVGSSIVVIALIVVHIPVLLGVIYASDKHKEALLRIQNFRDQLGPRRRRPKAAESALLIRALSSIERHSVAPTPEDTQSLRTQRSTQE